MRMPGSPAVRVALKVVVFIFLALAGEVLFGWTLTALFDPKRNLLAIAVLSSFFAALAANALSLRIWEQRTLIDIGLNWNGASVRNLLLGFAGGIGAALVVVLGPVVEGAAQLEKLPQPLSWPVLIFVPIALLFGVIG